MGEEALSVNALKGCALSRKVVKPLDLPTENKALRKVESSPAM
jgi:hypothetical protein